MTNRVTPTSDTAVEIYVLQLLVSLVAHAQQYSHNVNTNSQLLSPHTHVTFFYSGRGSSFTSAYSTNLMVVNISAF